MTGFGRRRVTIDGRDITVEMKSVNSKGFDCTVRTTRGYAFLEEKVRQRLIELGVSRGKVEVYVGVDLIEREGVTINLDTAYTASYVAALERLRDEFKLRDDISVSRVATNRDIFIEIKPEDDLERDWDDVKTVLDGAVSDFIESRKLEGTRLCTDIAVKLGTVAELAAKIKTLSDADIAAYPSKLEEKLRKFIADASVTADENRILTEIAIFADRASIDEELVRLSSHMKHFEELAVSEEPVGRPLDFLMQEINREVNTIGSKQQNTEIAYTVVEIKTELEKIREQIQNIE